MGKDDHGCEPYTEWKKQNRITQAKHLRALVPVTFNPTSQIIDKPKSTLAFLNRSNLSKPTSMIVTWIRRRSYRTRLKNVLHIVIQAHIEFSVDLRIDR
jgi:hypothetical protein